MVCRWVFQWLVVVAAASALQALVDAAVAVGGSAGSPAGSSRCWLVCPDVVVVTAVPPLLHLIVLVVLY